MHFLSAEWGWENGKFANCHLSGVRFCWRLMKKTGRKLLHNSNGIHIFAISK